MIYTNTLAIRPEKSFIPHIEFNGNPREQFKKLLKNDVIGWTGFKLLNALSFHAYENGRCYPGIDKLAARVKCSTKTITRTIKKLINEGLIQCDAPDPAMRRWKRYGNQYWFLWSPLYGKPKNAMLTMGVSWNVPWNVPRSLYNIKLLKFPVIHTTTPTSPEPTPVDNSVSSSQLSSHKQATGGDDDRGKNGNEKPQPYNHDEIKSDDIDLKNLLEPLCHEMKSLKPHGFNPFQFTQYLMLKKHSADFIADILHQMIGIMRAGNKKIHSWFQYGIGIIRRTLNSEKREAVKQEAVEQPKQASEAPEENTRPYPPEIDENLKRQVNAICDGVDAPPHYMFYPEHILNKLFSEGFEDEIIIKSFEHLRDLIQQGKTPERHCSFEALCKADELTRPKPLKQKNHIIPRIPPAKPKALQRQGQIQPYTIETDDLPLKRDIETLCHDIVTTQTEIHFDLTGEFRTMKSKNAHPSSIKSKFRGFLEYVRDLSGPKTHTGDWVPI